MQRAAAVFDISGSDETLFSDRCLYFGYSIRENAGTPAAATVVIRDGDATGAILDVIELAGDGSAQAFYPGGIRASGIYVDVVAGAVEGSVRYA